MIDTFHGLGDACNVVPDGHDPGMLAAIAIPAPGPHEFFFDGRHIEPRKNHTPRSALCRYVARQPETI